MNKDILYHNLKLICEKLTIEQIFYARRNRDWEKFDKLSEVEKLLYRLEELQIYEDILNENDENNFDD
jgi:hypothetical protein